MGLKRALQAFNYFAGGDSTGVGDVVDAKRGADLPKIQRRLNEILQMRDGVDLIVNRGLLLQAAQQVARFFPLVEGKPRPPNVVLSNIPDPLFRQSLSPAIEVEHGISKAKVRFVQLRK